MIQKRKRNAKEPGEPTLVPPGVDVGAIRRNLLRWYQEHRRQLPWREQADPYAIWVSEVMLQQTQVSTVEPYYRRWLTAFPTVAALAAANEAQVLQLWQGLGYYSRARSLHRGAQQVVADGGALPRSAEALRRLPGIGPYTAGAIASIAFAKDEPLVDGNVVRVLTRLLALPGDPKKSQVNKQVWATARALLPKGKAGDFNQGLMELGALRCTPRKPLCGECPLHGQCQAFAQGTPERYPETSPRPKATPVAHIAALARRRGRILVVQLPPNAPRWAGLWLLPHAELAGEEAPEVGAIRALHALGLTADTPVAIHSLKHSITRYRVTLTLVDCKAPPGHLAHGDSLAAARFATLDELEGLAMPAPQRKLVRWLAAR